MKDSAFPGPPNLLPSAYRLQQLRSIVQGAWPAFKKSVEEDDCSDLLGSEHQAPFSYSWVLIHGEKGMGQSRLLRAILHELEVCGVPP